MRSTPNPAKARPVPKAAAAKTGRAGAGRRVRAAVRDTWRDPRADFNQDEWYDMVAAAAALRAEARGFDSSSSSEDDWCETEAELRERLARAEDEADEKSESAADLADHDTWRERDNA
jgi:hypothetical protein